MRKVTQKAVEQYAEQGKRLDYLEPWSKNTITEMSHMRSASQPALPSKCNQRVQPLLMKWMRMGTKEYSIKRREKNNLIKLVNSFFVFFLGSFLLGFISFLMSIKHGLLCYITS
jgi:hypothetical protein